MSAVVDFRRRPAKRQSDEELGTMAILSRACWFAARERGAGQCFSDRLAED